MPQHRNTKRKSRPGLPPLRTILQYPCHLWRKNVWHKVWLILLAVVLLFVGSAYGIAQQYIWQQRNKPLNLGVTFIADYATYLNVDPHETLQAIFDDLQPSQVRLVSYWDGIEATKGVYDFSNLDWQVKMAEDHGVAVSLAVGLRQPRWPECHMPTWAMNQPKNVWYPELKRFMTAVVEHYRTSPALQSYQLENEFFLSVFGICPDFSRDRLIEEYKLVKQLDPTHPIIVSRSNNAVGFPINEPTPDVYGVSVYKRVWDKTLTKRYVEYPFPAWFYGFLAGGGKIITGKDLIIHELQAEAWTAEGYDIRTADTKELYKSMDPVRLKNRFEYARGSGMKTIDLWGVEWWYSMKVTRSQPGLWETGKAEFQKARQENARLPKN